MNFSDFLKNERKENKISARKLSTLIGKSSTYIYSIEKGLFNPDYVTAIKILNNLNINLPNNKISDFLSSLNIIVPTTTNTSKDNSDAWGTQENEIDDIKKNDLPDEKDFMSEDEIMEMDNAINEIKKNEMDINSNYSFNKQKELKEIIKQIYIKLNSYLNENFDPNDYSNNHNAELVLTTLKGLFDMDNSTLPMFQFFLKLMSLPLHTITNIEYQDEILKFINSKCISQYVFVGAGDNDSERPNHLCLGYKTTNENNM